LPDDEADYMGRFWYGCAAGEIYINRAPGANK
jgi:hypothetical protein